MLAFLVGMVLGAASLLLCWGLFRLWMICQLSWRRRQQRAVGVRQAINHERALMLAAREYGDGRL